MPCVVAQPVDAFSDLSALQALREVESVRYSEDTKRGRGGNHDRAHALDKDPILAGTKVLPASVMNSLSPISLHTQFTTQIYTSFRIHKRSEK